jgi:hypothetical protein
LNSRKSIGLLFTIAASFASQQSGGFLHHFDSFCRFLVQKPWVWFSTCRDRWAGYKPVRRRLTKGVEVCQTSPIELPLVRRAIIVASGLRATPN